MHQTAEKGKRTKRTLAERNTKPHIQETYPHMAHRCVCANRQIKQHGRTPQDVIGNITNLLGAEKVNGELIAQMCYKENTTPMTTWQRTPLGEGEKENRE